MKKIALVAALVLTGSAVFAQVPGGMMGQGRGAGFGPSIDWKVGTVVTTEYKKVTGQISSTTTLWGDPMVFKADGIEYQLFLPRVTELASLKSGDTITLEGTFTNVKADPKVSPTAHAFKVTVAGKEIDLSTLANGRGVAMSGRDRGMDSRGMGGRGNGMRY